MAATKEQAEKAIADAKAAVDANKDAVKKNGRPRVSSWPGLFKTEQEATEEAARRQSGPKRPFMVKVTKSIPVGDYFVVAHHANEAFNPLAIQGFGAEVVEIGKAPRAPRAPKSELASLADLTADKKAEAAKAMTPERKAELKKQAEELLKLLK